MEPTWIYHPTEPAKIVDLERGAAPPDGWSRSPSVVLDPSHATAEALTIAVTGRSFALHYEGSEEMVAPTSPDPEALVSALTEIDRLKGIIAAGSQENEALVVEIERAEGVLGAAAAEIGTLKAALEKALADGADLAAARDEAGAAVERLTGELAEARKDLEAATAPKTAAKAR